MASSSVASPLSSRCTIVSRRFNASSKESSEMASASCPIGGLWTWGRPRSSGPLGGNLEARSLWFRQLAGSGELPLIAQRVEVHQPLNQRRYRQHDDADADRPPAYAGINVERSLLGHLAAFAAADDFTDLARSEIADRRHVKP